MKIKWEIKCTYTQKQNKKLKYGIKQQYAWEVHIKIEIKLIKTNEQ